MALDPMDELIAERCTTALNAIIALLPEDDKPARVVYVVPGEAIVWDECCAGQLTARLATFVPHFSSGSRPATLTPCSIDYWTATVEITMLRCSANVDNQGEAPSPEAITQTGLFGLTDMRIMLEAIVKLPFVDGVPTWNPVGPDGGCQGIVWRFTMKVDSPPCE